MKAFRSSLVTLVVQNLREIVLYIDFRVLSLRIKAVAFLFSCFYHYLCDCSNSPLVACLIHSKKNA